MRSLQTGRGAQYKGYFPAPVYTFFCGPVLLELDLLSYDSKLTETQEQYDWMTELFLMRALGGEEKIQNTHRSGTSPTVPGQRLVVGQNFHISSLVQIFSVIQSYCSRISVVLLSYNNRTSLIRLGHRKTYAWVLQRRRR